MNLFRLPSSLISKLYSLCVRFWWGGGVIKQKMHWCSWENIRKSKSEEGLGFRDLGAFNKAMLDKQCWCLIQCPNSLAAKVIKGCYYPFTDLLKANSNKNGLFLWKSIFLGVGS